MRQLIIGEVEIAPGSSRDLKLAIGQRPTGENVTLPVRIIRAAADGPIVFVSGAVHGDDGS